MKRNTKIHKKSQITIFILLGLVIFIIFGYLIYVTSNLSENTIQNNQEQVRKQLLTTTSIKYYITTCLDESTENALKLIGDQGGRIFDFQGGLIDFNVPYTTYNSSGKSYNVSYLVYRSNTTEDTGGANILGPPQYPCLNLASIPVPCSSTGTFDPYPCCTAPICPASSRCDYCNFYGSTCYNSYDHTLSSPSRGFLFDFGSTKDPINQLHLDLLKSNISVGLLNYYCGENVLDNWQNNRDCNYSIQRQLEHYISKETKECINLSVFKTYNLTEGNITVNVTFGLNDILISMQYPLKIKQKNKPTSDAVLYFTLPPKKVRLLEIFEETIKELVREEETRYLRFNLTDEIENLQPNFIVNKLKKSRDASIIIVNDTLSRLGGQPYSFQFAVENRGPALNYVRSADGYANGTSCTVAATNYDVCITVNETIFLKPEGFDPDDDFLVYSYEGWRETDFMNSYVYQFGNTTECNDSQRCATYKTNESDQGERNVTIRISDGKNIDFQPIKIYVNNRPNPTLSTSSAAGCKWPDGSTIDWAGRRGEPYTINVDCGSINNPYSYQWYLNSIFAGSVDTDNCNPAKSFTILSEGTHTIGLNVTDNSGANTMISYTLYIYDDSDDDDFCINNPSAPVLCGNCIDCNDSNSSIKPTSSDDNCNGVDDDCDGSIDESYIPGWCGQNNANGNCIILSQCIAGNVICPTVNLDCGECFNCSTGDNPSCIIPYTSGEDDVTLPLLRAGCP